MYRQDYSQARGYLENVLNNYSYDLVDDYGDLFNIDTEMNSESIFSLAFLQGANDHNLSHIFIANEGLFGYSNRGSRITRPTWDLHKRFHEDDSRFENTMWETFIPANGSALQQQVYAEPHMRYFPIPQEQINISSPGVLQQNPGYDGN